MIYKEFVKDLDTLPIYCIAFRLYADPDLGFTKVYTKS